eukprot:NODE_79_length_23048_cov_0.747614.p11 type:complete len:197 gc:universal NODE_79_length_23048_cov_0.747614:17463-18053(+)
MISHPSLKYLQLMLGWFLRFNVNPSKQIIASSNQKEMAGENFEVLSMEEDKNSEIPRITIRVKITSVLYYKFCSVLSLAIMNLVFRKWAPGILLLVNGIAGLGAVLSRRSKFVFYDIFLFIAVQIVHIGLIISELFNLDDTAENSHFRTDYNLSYNKTRDAYLAVYVIDLLMNLSLTVFISWSLYEYRTWLKSHNK